jgi:hypothetical protein
MAFSIPIISSWASRPALRVAAGTLLALASSCASEPGPPPEYPPMEAPAAAAEEPSTPPEPPQPSTPPPPPVQVVAGDDTPLAGAPPTVKLRTPRDGQLIKADKVEVTLDVKSWALSPEGDHIHLILDNEPYIAVRDASKPIDLNALVEKELKKPLSEGTHVLRAFPGRGHHESVKQDAAFDWRVFHYKQKTADFSWNPKAPLLTFSRPKGCVDAGTRVLLDFFVNNTKLGATEHRVRYIIDGTLSGDIVQWKPHYIENLTVGDHTLELSLRDANGELVAGPFNDTKRTIKVAPDCKALASAAVSGTPASPPPNPPLAATPTPAGPTTPPAAAPTEKVVPKPAP